MEIDIRKPLKDEIHTIKFSSCSVIGYFADCLVSAKGRGISGKVFLKNTGGDLWLAGIKSEEDAKNLIKALEKAIELGWFE